MAADPGDPRYELVWNESLRSITQQQALLESLRGRTGTLLSAAAIATSFLGGVAFDDQKVTSEGKIAVLLFALVGVLCVWVLRPRPNWHFRNAATSLIDEYVEGDSPCSLDELHKELALHNEKNYTTNQKKLHRMMVQYQVATAALIAEIVAWLIELGAIA